MAIQREIWAAAIVEGLFADNTFASKAVNADSYVSNKRVHIPNAGAPSGVSKNREETPAKIKLRNDTDVDFTLDEFTTDPIKITNAESIELSYDKRTSVIKQDKAQLMDVVHTSLIYNWLPTKSDRLIQTSGDAVNAHTAGATGQRKSFTKTDVRKAAAQFDKENVPAVGRYLLVDAVMYYELVDSLTNKESEAFFSAVNVATGVVGNLYGFDIMKRSQVGLYTTAGVKKEFSAKGVATDNAAALAWSEGYVARALGEVVAFEDIGNPTLYADVFSFLARAAGHPMSSTEVGICAIVQAKVA